MVRGKNIIGSGGKPVWDHVLVAAIATPVGWWSKCVERLEIFPGFQGWFE